MAKQHVVAALVPRTDADTLALELAELDGAGVVGVDQRRPAPAEYRDEEPDRRLHRLVRIGRARLLVGASIGAVVGALIGTVLPGLNDFLPWTALLLAFGGAWGLGVAAAARGIQVHKREDDLGERTHEVTGRQADDHRLLLVEVDQDREKVADHLEARGATLLDSWHPIVGDDGGLTRPARRGPTADARGGSRPAGEVRS
ncbi:SLC45 family MFS transporter [Nitriliruptoraceae bacterium ZYF776]|nr:SLC45 family MFS transporter [Profundirhabdus halotolerans]